MIKFVYDLIVFVLLVKLARFDISLKLSRRKKKLGSCFRYLVFPQIQFDIKVATSIDE